MCDRVNTLVSLALTLEQQGKYDQALQKYDAALEEEISVEARGGVCLNRGNVLRFLHREEEAKHAYFDALQSPASLPVIPHILNNLALVFFDQDAWHEAFACIDEGITRYSDSPQFRTTRAMVLYHLNRYAEALRDSHEALQHNPNDGLAQKIATRAVSEVKRMEDLLLQADAEIRSNASHVEGWRLRLVASLNLGHFNEVFWVAGRALAKCETWHEVYGLRAAAWFAKGILDRAVEDCDRAIAISDDSSMANHVRSAAIAVRELHHRIHRPQI